MLGPKRYSSLFFNTAFRSLSASTACNCAIDFPSPARSANIVHRLFRFRHRLRAQCFSTRTRRSLANRRRAPIPITGEAICALTETSPLIPENCHLIRSPPNAAIFSLHLRRAPPPDPSTHNFPKHDAPTRGQNFGCEKNPKFPEAVVHAFTTTTPLCARCSPSCRGSEVAPA